MKRTLIVGAGQACATILTEIFNAKHSPYEDDKISAEYDPVCIVDDNRRFIGREINGIRVVGMTYEIPSIVAKYKIEQIIFAIPSCEDEERKRILGICSASNVPVKIIPFIGNLIFDESRTKLVHQIRDISKELVKGLDIELYTLDKYSVDANFIEKLAEWNTTDSETYSCELPYSFEDRNSYSAYGVVIKNMPEGYVYTFSGENSKCFPVDYRPMTIWTDIINGNDTHEHEYVIRIEKEGTEHNYVTSTKTNTQTNVTTETSAIHQTLEGIIEFPAEGKFPMKFKVVDEASKELVKGLDIELYTLDKYSVDANFIEKLAEWNTTDSETYSCELPYSFEDRNSYSAYGVVIKNMPEGYVYTFSGENSKCFPVDYRPMTIWTDIINGNDTHEHEYVIRIEKEGTIHNPVTSSVSDSDVITTTTAAEPVNGDANCDFEVDMSDAVLIMQSIANPSKYKLTDQGSKNADMDGDGVTNADALAIQKKLLKLD